MDFEKFVASIVQEKFKQYDEDAADAREQQGIAQTGLGTRPMSDRPGMTKEVVDEKEDKPMSTATRVLTDMSDYYQPDEFPTQNVRIDSAPKFGSLNRSTVLDILSANRDGLEKQGIIKMPMGMLRKPDPTLDIDGLQSRILDKLDYKTPEGSSQDIQYGAELQKLGEVEDADTDIDVDRDAPAGKAQDNQPNINDGRGLGSRYKELEPLGDKFIERYAKVPNVDFEFIKQKEGFKTSMYVPKKKSGQVLGKSGATIASGFDLGQRNENDLTGLPPSLINKLKPYLGKKKKVAAKFVKDNPLSITESEANIINAFAKEQEMSRLIKTWNSSSDVRWEDLSVPQATAVASVHFQYGNLPAKTPKFWRYTTTGDWSAARDELDNFGDDYPTRRKSEADYLEQDNAAILGTKAS